MSPLIVLSCLLLIASGTAVWSLWQRYVVPQGIADADIESSVRALLTGNGDPLRRARIETYQAWLDGDLKAQGKWRRVERALKKQLPG